LAAGGGPGGLHEGGLQPGIAGAGAGREAFAGTLVEGGGGGGAGKEGGGGGGGGAYERGLGGPERGGGFGRGPALGTPRWRGAGGNGTGGWPSRPSTSCTACSRASTWVRWSWSRKRW